MTDEDGWLECSTLCEPEAVESLSEAFAKWGQGVAVEQPVVSSRDGDRVELPTDQPLLVKTYLPLKDPDAHTRRVQIELAVWALGQLRQVGPLTVRTLREEDWANAWKDHFFVQRIGARTVIVPSWRADDYQPRPGDILLLLDPGMAFGTGLHPTTRLCVQQLERLVAPGQRVLDLGAGSGILAIAAARLGADEVHAVEIDAVAADVCRQNVERNGVSDRVRVRQTTLAAPDAGAPLYDLVVANITIRVLFELHPLIRQHLRPGGQAVFSGVLAERAQELTDALLADGWQHLGTLEEADWVALHVRAPDA